MEQKIVVLGHDKVGQLTFSDFEDFILCKRKFEVFS